MIFLVEYLLIIFLFCRFYESLKGTSILINKTPTNGEIEDFWKPILGLESNKTPWIAEYKSTIDIQPNDFQPITTFCL